MASASHSFPIWLDAGAGYRHSGTTVTLSALRSNETCERAIKRTNEKKKNIVELLLTDDDRLTEARECASSVE